MIFTNSITVLSKLQEDLLREEVGVGELGFVIEKGTLWIPYAKPNVTKNANWLFGPKQLAGDPENQIQSQMFRFEGFDVAVADDYNSFEMLKGFRIPLAGILSFDHLQNSYKSPIVLDCKCLPLGNAIWYFGESENSQLQVVSSITNANTRHFTLLLLAMINKGFI